MPELGVQSFDERPRVLIVDDEEMVLSSIRSLLNIETDYAVECHTEPRVAVDYIKENGVDLVIADYLMPNMDGIEFLGQVKALQPETTRILLSGYADKESAIRAIDTVGLFQYIEKPWDNNQLLMVIRNGLEKRFLVRQPRQKTSELVEVHGGLKEIQKKLLRAFGQR